MAAPASAQCTLTGAATLSEARIDVPGAGPLVVDLEDQPLSLEMTEGSVATFRATGALDFSGRVAREGVPVALRRPTRVGALQLRPGTPIERAVVVADHLSVRMRLAHGLRADLDLPCDAARLGATADPPETTPEGAPTEGTLLVAVPRLRVHAAPAGPGSVTVVVERGTLRLAELERSGPWVHVRRDFFDGTTLDGWVRASEVRRVRSAELTEELWGDQIGTSGGCGHGASHTYIGPATLRAGAEVRTAPDGPVWARARRDVEVSVMWRYGAETVALERLEGLRARTLCPTLFEQAHVRRDDVVLPARAP